MKTGRTVPSTIDEYIAGFPRDVRQKLGDIRAAVRKAAPQAEEAIKYRMPAFVLNGNLVFFAAFKNHIGFYSASGDRALKAALAAYAGPKGSLKFPLDEPIPLGLVGRIVRFRVKENRERAKARTRKATSVTLTE